MTFVSWQIISSSVEIRFRCFTTMSGLREVNMSAIWLLGWPTKSTKTYHSSLTIDVIHCASISSMPSSCLRLYLASADGDAQLFSLCLFICRLPHSGHLSESVFFHLKRFAAVASCCWKAFLTNVKSVDGSIILRHLRPFAD